MTTPLVLLHGYPFDHSLWDQVIAQLPRETSIIAPDLRFMTKTGLAAEPALELLADDVLQAIGDAPRAMVAGMSMGGYVALAFAERHRERLAGLGLISSQSFADTDEGRNARRALIQRIKLLGTRPAIEALLPKLFAPQNNGRPDLEQFLITGAEKAGVAGLTWALEAMARRPDRTLLLGKLTVPILIAHGELDQLIPVERARRMATDAVQSKLVVIPSAGHCSPIETPAELAAALRDFLAACA